MDILPTLASVSNIPLEHEVHGLNLSHNLLDTPGKDRTHFAMAFEGNVYFVRDERFRLHEDGRFYEVPTTSNRSRYNMTPLKPNQFPEQRQQLQKRLDAFMGIQKTDTRYEVIPFGTNGDVLKNTQASKAIE